MIRKIFILFFSYIWLIFLIFAILGILNFIYPESIQIKDSFLNQCELYYTEKACFASQAIRQSNTLFFIWIPWFLIAYFWKKLNYVDGLFLFFTPIYVIIVHYSPLILLAFIICILGYIFGINIKNKKNTTTKYL